VDDRTRLFLITDRRRVRQPLPDLLEATLARVPPGAVIVQLREKDLEAGPLAELAHALLPICHRREAKLVVNDRLDVALALDLDGVHLPASSFGACDARRVLRGTKLVGVSCHSAADIEAARANGADYGLFGPIFDTPSKRAYGPPLGLRELTHAAAMNLPLFGVGGISSERAKDVRATGARGVAVIGAWLDASDPSAAVAGLLP
jgi:thiamine-phosphate pyrophosphorylase